MLGSTVYVSVRKGDGGRWPSEAISRLTMARALSPSNKRALHAQATLYASPKERDPNDAALQLAIEAPDLNIKLNSSEGDRLLVPERVHGHETRRGLRLRSLDERKPIGDWILPSASDARALRVLEQRGLMLLVRRSVATRRTDLITIDIVSAPEVPPTSEAETVWLNPLVLVLNESALLPESGNTTLAKEVEESTRGNTSFLAGELSVAAERRAAGWEALWGPDSMRNDGGRSLLDALFKQDTKPSVALPAPWVELAMLDSLSGAFFALRNNEDTTIRWLWSPGKASSESAQSQLAKWLCRRLGIDHSSPHPANCFVWGAGRHRPPRLPLAGFSGTTVPELLKGLAHEVRQGLLAKLLKRFACMASRMGDARAKRIFAPLLHHKDGLDDTARLLNVIVGEFFLPISPVHVPLALATPDAGVDVASCFATNDFAQVFDPFRSPESPLSLLRAVAVQAPRPAPSSAWARSPWYSALWRHVAVGNMRKVFRLTERSGPFTLNQSRLGTARLGARRP